MNKIKTDFFFYGTLPNGDLVSTYYKITKHDINKGSVQGTIPCITGSSVDDIKTKLSTNLTPTYQGQVSSVDRIWLATKNQINQYLIALKGIQEEPVKKEEVKPNWEKLFQCFNLEQRLGKLEILGADMWSSLEKSDYKSMNENLDKIRGLLDTKIVNRTGKTLFRDYFGLDDFISFIPPGHESNLLTIYHRDLGPELFDLCLLRANSIYYEEFEACKKIAKKISKIKNKLRKHIKL